MRPSGAGAARSWLRLLVLGARSSRDRERLSATGEPLLRAAQQRHQLRLDVTFEQALDLVMAIAKIPGSEQYRSPLLDAGLRGLLPAAALEDPHDAPRGRLGGD
ncbi:hypothetical protein ACIA8K_20790 [Catenuloplanes sp. NPDC051500]|uniref:hypothetical protein n=1 Tax=Catenuloplanes sp. NPDC051500 TaxID=3363959 RepID=UPI0037A6E81A